VALDSGRHRIESVMVQPSTKHPALPVVVDHHVGVAATQLLAQAASRSARGPRARLRKRVMRQVVFLEGAGLSDIVLDLNLGLDVPRQPYSYVDPHGRSLSLVAGLSGALGFLPAAAGGTLVWAVLDAARSTPTDQPTSSQSCRRNPGVSQVDRRPSVWAEHTCGARSPPGVDRFALFKPCVGGFRLTKLTTPELRVARCHRTEGVAHVTHRSRQVHQRCHRQAPS